TRKADSSTPQQKSYVNVFENSPWDVNGNFTVPAPETLTRVGEYTEREPKVDIKTTVINDADGILYFHLTWNDTANGTGGNDYYGINNANTAAEKPHIELVESSIGIVAPKKTLHQYPQIEEKNKPGQIKPFGTMTRYDYNGLDKTYAYENQVDGDPMSFSLVAIKPNKIPNNHFGAGTKADFSAEPLFINPMMAPVEWVGVTPEPTESGDSLDIGSQWRNYLRWKNNRLFYKLPSQDSYLNLTTYETVDNKGNADASDDDVYSYATNAFNIVPTKQNTGTEQIITFNDVADVTKTIEAEKPSFASFNISPKSSVVDLPVDIMVEYGPVKVASSRNADGSYDYTVSADRIPKGAKYPIEVKLVATQFGVAWGGRTVKTAKPVEKIFYINENSGVSTEAPVNDGEIFGTELLAKNITGFNVIGNGTIALSQNQNPGFTSLKAATLRNERLNTADVNYKKHYVYKEGYNPTDYWSDFGNTWTAVVSGDGFIPLSAFTKNEKNNIDLRLINQLKRTGNITSITPVSTQTEVINPRTMPWGSGVNVVWQNALGASYDRVEIYDGQTKVGSALNGESRVYVPITADKELMVKTIKGENASPGIPIQAKYLPSKYIVDDFETGDLSAGSNWVSESARNTNDAYSNSLGAILTINKDAQNHYLAVGHGYTGLTPQTVETKISALPRDVKGVRLRTKGVSYAGGGLVNDESYHVLLSSPNGDKTDTYKANIGTRISQNMQEIYIPISEFVSEDYSANGKNVPLTADALVNIDTIKIGVRNPQDRNQKRVALFHDDIEFVTDTSCFMNNIKCLSDKTKAIVTWEKPTAVYDEIRVYQDDVLKRTLPSGEIQTVFNGLTKGQKYIFKFEVMSGNVIKSVHTIETTSGDIDTAEKMEQTLLDNFFNTTPLAGTPENGGFLTSLLSGYEIVDKNINGLYWAFGENTMTATVKTSIALTKPEQLVIVLSENKEDGESYVAKIGDKITSADSWTTVEVPFADFVLLEEKKNNGKLDIAAISNVKIGRCESVESEYILSVCGFMPFDINGPKTTKLSLLTEKSFKINGEHTDVNMVGRGRVSLLSFDAAAFKGMTATNANLSLSLKKGQNNPVAVFLAPDDSWKTATQGKNVLFDGKNLDSDFKIFTDGGREKVFPAYAGNEKTTDTKNNDVLPTENERILDLESASMGTMKDYFFGDYSLDCTKGMDISKTVNAALNRGDKTINIMLFTPYTRPATMDLYNTISAGVDTSKIPSLTMSYQKAYVMGEVLRDLNIVTVNVSVNVKNPNAWLFICGYTENNLCDVEVVKDIKDIN
ncbi:MAG: hypothetical protein RSC29_01725, partial [Oscillospiraceae bacterium]